MKTAGKRKRCERQHFEEAVQMLFGRRGRPQLRRVADVPEHHAFVYERCTGHDEERRFVHFEKQAGHHPDARGRDHRFAWAG